jgi:hypothetical protein
MRRDIQVGRAMTTANFAAALFRTPERFVTELKAIGMPKWKRPPQPVLLQAFAIETPGLPGEWRIALCLKEARNLPDLQAELMSRPSCGYRWPKVRLLAWQQCGSERPSNVSQFDCRSRVGNRHVGLNPRNHSFAHCRQAESLTYRTGPVRANVLS